MTQENNPLADALAQQEAVSQTLNDQLFGGNDMTVETEASKAAQLMAARLGKQNQPGEVFVFGGVQYFDSEQVKCFGEMMSLAEVRKLTEGFGGTSVSLQNAIMKNLATTGDLVFIDRRSPLEKKMDKAEARINQQMHSEDLDYQESQIRARKLHEERSNGFSQAGTLDFFSNQTQLQNFLMFAEEIQLEVVSVGMNAANCPNCEVVNVTEWQLKQIRSYVREHKLGLTTKKAVQAVERTLSKSTRFAVESVASPVLKSTVSFSGSVIGSTVKATTDVGVQVVNSLVDESQTVARKWNQDPDTQRAVKRVNTMFGGIKRKLGGSSATMSGINLR